MAGERIPDWLKSRVSPAQIERVRRAVQEAESRTSAEIVPMIVRRSSAVGQVPIVASLITVVVALLVLVAARDLLTDLEATVIAFAIFPVGLVSGLWLSRLDFIQRLLIPNADEIAQVWRRALVEFSEAKLGATGGRNGVLVLISVMERRAVILPDLGVAKALTTERCQELVSRMAERLGKGEWAGALEQVITETADELAPVHPPKGAARNELANDLIIKD